MSSFRDLYVVNTTSCHSFKMIILICNETRILACVNTVLQFRLCQSVTLKEYERKHVPHTVDFDGEISLGVYTR